MCNLLPSCTSLWQNTTGEGVAASSDLTERERERERERDGT